MNHNRGLWRDIRYGCAAFVLGVPTIPLFVLLPPLYADTLGIGLTATGIALFFARAFDVLSDPIVGYASDHLKSRWGARKPLILMGTILGGAGFVFLLTPSDGAGPWYLGFWAIILYLGWTLINIPYLSWGASLSDEYQGRARVTSIRELFTILGIVVAAAIPAIASGLGYDERGSLGFIAWGLLIVGTVLFFILLRFVSDSPSRVSSTNNQNLRQTLRSISSNGPFRLLIVSWLINSLANGMPAVLFILFMKYLLDANVVERGILTFAYFVAGLIGIPVWLQLSKRIGKHRAWSIAMLSACLAFAFVPAMREGDVFLFGMVCVVTGIALGADLALPPAIQADVVEYELFRTGQENSGMMFSIWSMVTKIAFALSVLVAFPALEALGFSTDLPREKNNLVALAVFYAVIPIILKLGAVTLVWQYPLTAKRQKIIQKRMENRSGVRNPATNKT
ncbi:MAG: MFS transporter [Rhodospirillaceae bacterium]|nr:MFS transporter [Rhodospirillaceae bacterium]|tara:strand:+ start:6136 stop:7491 length:1356 start_codon:yes stop_codon:yes gene_type:complete